MIRDYTKKDKQRVIELLVQNIPEYFAPSEEEDFVHYLDHELEDYFVYVEGATIIGAGGVNYFPEEKIARISWDMIDTHSQGKGVGKDLLRHRINHINKKSGIDFIEVRTSQLAYKFYEKMGFALETIEKDYWAKGFDLYQMKMENKG
ncbi:GNAT family N-acetyltransferase [Marinifilum caeruleilacunae]|uniref:GNAT family N-acetyltransferase n=1 Tax=Marinifilum caeruleilacunae TaxID=2499076 RepID=A0ABX1X1F2_9BACT|nr:GNAT family N-acetyltransferase [Marinifilum caeruleilacunae]NOU62250.1 GNAT family N-acetyltransferase [Marinifilum caeruleilacunae]